MRLVKAYNSRVNSRGSSGSISLKLLLACVASLVAGTAVAQNSAFVLDEAGYTGAYHSPADATFKSGVNNTNSVFVDVTGNTNTGSRSYYSMFFTAPHNGLLQPGVYENTTASGPTGSSRPGLALYFSGGNFSCSSSSEQTGRFEVKEVVYGEGGHTLISFHATFSLSCGGAPDRLIGEVLVNSGNPVPPRNHLTGHLNVFGTEGQPFHHRITANNNPTNFTAAPLPPGLALNPSTGVITGTPTTQGTYVVDVTASGSGGTAAGALTITIDPPQRSRGPFTALFINSAPGDTLGQGQVNFYGPSDGEFRPSGSPRSVFVSFNTPDREISWDIAFEVPYGQELQLGTYRGAQRSYSTNAPTLTIYSRSGSCSDAVGEFEIKELVFGPNSRVDAFRASFVNSCGASAPPLKGEIWFRSGLSITSRPHAITTRDTTFSHQIVANNEPTGFTASGLPPGLNLDGATGLISGTPTVSGTYSVLLRSTGNLGRADGSLELVVLKPDSAPATTVITSPGSATVKRNDAFSYQITATDNPIQFGADGLPEGLVVDAATGQITGTPAVAGTFSIVLTASNGIATGGGSLVLSVVPPPPVFTSPDAAEVMQARPFSFQLLATDEPTSFKATGLPFGLSISAAGVISGTTYQTGSFSVSVVARNAGGAGSQNLTLTVKPASYFANISTRLGVESGENVLIGGFIVTGDAPKRVIIRAIGSSLTADGIPMPGRLEDPELEFFAGSTRLAYNDNWRFPHEQAIRETTIPPNDDREAAMVRQLTPGSYTAVVRGKGNTTGVGLVEVYDLDAPSRGSLLANISTRGLIRAGETMIAGSILRGNEGQRIVLRAIGPSLAQAGIAQPLANPMLELVDANGSSLAFNNDWQDSQAGDIQASGFAPSDPREAAIVTTLPAGDYTAVVRSSSGEAAGVALVEVYRLE